MLLVIHGLSLGYFVAVCQGENVSDAQFSSRINISSFCAHDGAEKIPDQSFVVIQWPKSLQLLALLCQNLSSEQTLAQVVG